MLLRPKTMLLRTKSALLPAENRTAAGQCVLRVFSHTKRWYDCDAYKKVVQLYHLRNRKGFPDPPAPDTRHRTQKKILTVLSPEVLREENDDGEEFETSGDHQSAQVELQAG